jgi:hypothetical protein
MRANDKQRSQQANEVVANHDSTWSARCSTPAKKSDQRLTTHSVTNKPTMSSDSELTDHRQESADDQPYTVQQTRKKRLRSPLLDAGGKPVIINATRRGSLIIGASTSSKNSSAKSKLRKIQPFRENPFLYWKR